MIDAQGHPVPVRAGGRWRPYAGDLRRALLTTEAAVAISSLLVERRLLAEVGGFDDRPRLPFREDYDLALRLALRERAVVVPEVVCYVRDHEHRATAGREDLQARTAEVYLKLSGIISDRELRRLCRSRRAGRLVADADRLAVGGAPGAALLRLGQAGLRQALSARWWKVLAKVLLCPIARAAGLRVAGCGSST